MSTTMFETGEGSPSNGHMATAAAIRPTERTFSFHLGLFRSFAVQYRREVSPRVLSDRRVLVASERLPRAEGQATLPLLLSPRTVYSSLLDG